MSATEQRPAFNKAQDDLIKKVGEVILVQHQGLWYRVTDKTCYADMPSVDNAAIDGMSLEQLGVLYGEVASCATKSFTTREIAASSVYFQVGKMIFREPPVPGLESALDTLRKLIRRFDSLPAFSKILTADYLMEIPPDEHEAALADFDKLASLGLIKLVDDQDNEITEVSVTEKGHEMATKTAPKGKAAKATKTAGPRTPREPVTKDIIIPAGTPKAMSEDSKVQKACRLMSRTNGASEAEIMATTNPDDSLRPFLRYCAASSGYGIEMLEGKRAFLTYPSGMKEMLPVRTAKKESATKTAPAKKEAPAPKVAPTKKGK